MAKKKKRSGRKIEGIPVEDIDKPYVGSPVIARGGVPLNITPPRPRYAVRVKPTA